MNRKPKYIPAMNHKYNLNKILKRQLFETMLKIRLAEEKIVAVYHEQHMRTPTHLSIGQEAVAVGICSALKKDDQVFSPHRCHAHYLAKGGNLNAFFAELCGRETGSNRGRVGSAHLTDEKAHVYASPILGAMIPVAVGAALAFKMDRLKKVAVAFLGDAAIEEGIFTESLNFAIVKKLPVLFVCENNLYSTNSPLRVRQPPSPLYKRVSLPELSTQQIDGNDVEKVYQAASKAIQQCRRGKGPIFIECLTYRIHEHVGPLMDYDKGYRSKKEVESWIKKCPIKRFKSKLIKGRIMNSKEIDALTAELKKDMNEAYVKALQSPWPDTKTLLDHVY